MKNIKTLMMGFSIVLAGCGMTDPWEEYENQGNFTDRLLPSDLKAALCSSDAWKMTYQDTDFYFSFSEDGTVVCNSNMFKDETSAEYLFDWDDPMTVELRVIGTSHFQYMSGCEFSDAVYVTSCSEGEIKCKPSISSETEYLMTSVSASDVETMNGRKTELRDILIGEDGWKVSLSGNECYLLFSDNGIVACLSEGNPVENTSFTFSGTITDPVLEVPGLSCLSGTSYVVEYESADTQTMTLKELSSDTTIEMTVADTEALESVIESNKSSIVDAFIENNYKHGVVRSAAGQFLAHYVMSSNESDGKNTFTEIKFDVLHNRVLTHKTVSVADVDIYGNIIFSESVDINGVAISSFVYNLSANTISANDGKMNITSNNDVVDWFINDFRTYLVRPSSQENRGDMSDDLMKELNDNTYYWDKFEVSDRTNRPIVFTPKGGNFEGRTWTCLYSANSNPLDNVRTDEVDKVKFDRPYTAKDIWGNDVNADHVNEIAGFYSKILDAYYHEDGLYLVLEGVKNEDNSQLYLISPTTGNWFKCDRDL